MLQAVGPCQQQRTTPHLLQARFTCRCEGVYSFLWRFSVVQVCEVVQTTNVCSGHWTMDRAMHVYFYLFLFRSFLRLSLTLCVHMHI